MTSKIRIDEKTTALILTKETTKKDDYVGCDDKTTTSKVTKSDDIENDEKDDVESGEKR